MPHRSSHILSDEPVDFSHRFLLPTIQAVTEPTQEDIERFQAAGRQPNQFEEALEFDPNSPKSILEAVSRAVLRTVPSSAPEDVLPAIAPIPGVGVAFQAAKGVTAIERLASQAVLGANVFHGTGLPPKGQGIPPFERFDVSKVGGPGGEGAQMYGHGIYFAESPGTAKTYQMSHGAQNIFIDGVNLRESPYDIAVQRALVDNFGDVDAAIAAKKRQLVEHGGDISSPTNMLIQSRIDVLKSLRGRVTGGQGSLIEADIPDEQIARMLDWDKPVADQEIAIKIIDEWGYSVKHFENGDDLYRQAIQETGSPQAASEYLASRGIPGIKYKAGQIAGWTGPESRNLVVFDDSIVDILKVNDVPVKKPMKAFHGTRSSETFDVFSTEGSKFGRVQGAYFSKNKSGAERWIKNAEGPKRMMEVELNIQNPANREVLDEIGYGLSGEEMREELIRRGYDGVIDDFMHEVVAFYPEQVKIKKQNVK